MDIRNDYFTKQEEALAEIEAAGLHPITIDFEAETVGDHWHDFDATLYILEGTLNVTDVETGESCSCPPGTRLVAKAGVLHREQHDGYKALIGLSVDPAKLTQPINKPPPVELAGG